FHCSCQPSHPERIDSMLKNIFTLTIDGYGSGETDFGTRLANASSDVQIDFENFILGSLIAVLSSTDQTAVLEVAGHSDRVDTEGLSREERRLQELQASIDRTNSAADTIFAMLAAAFGPGFPSDWAKLDQVAVAPIACGGAVLLFSSGSLSDAERRAN